MPMRSGAGRRRARSVRAQPSFGGQCFAVARQCVQRDAIEAGGDEARALRRGAGGSEPDQRRGLKRAIQCGGVERAGHGLGRAQPGDGAALAEPHRGQHAQAWPIGEAELGKAAIDRRRAHPIRAGRFQRRDIARAAIGRAAAREGAGQHLAAAGIRDRDAERRALGRRPADKAHPGDRRGEPGDLG
jgi:hypothetical protein